MDLDDNKYTRLPKWARDEILQMRREINSYKEKFSQIDGDQDSNVKWSSGLMDYHNLPMDSQVYFNFGGRNVIDVFIQGNALRVSCNGILKITPSASNSILVEQN